MIVDLFKILRESGLLTAAFIIGAIAVFIAIVGNIKALIELSSSRAFALAVFGIVLMGLSIGGYFVSLQTTSTDAPAKGATPVVVSLQPMCRNQLTPRIQHSRRTPFQQLHHNKRCDLQQRLR